MLPDRGSVWQARLVRGCAGGVLAAPSRDPHALEAQVEARLHDPWGDRHCTRTTGDLRHWLEERKLWPSGEAKPPDPKAAYLRVLREVRVPPSNAIFRRLAASVGLRRCQDPAFQRAVKILREWFGHPAA